MKICTINRKKQAIKCSFKYKPYGTPRSKVLKDFDDS